MKLKIDTKYIILIGVAALFFRVCGIDYGLPFLYNVDEAGLVRAAVRFGSGDFNTHGVGYQPLPAYLFFGLYIVYYAVGRVFGIFSCLADFKALYFSDPSAFYLIGRLTLAVMGVATVIVIYLLGKKAFNRTTGVIASLFFTVARLPLIYSRATKPDGVMTLFIVLSFYFIYEISQNGRLKNYLWAGIFGGLAITTKYNAGLIVLPILAVHLMNLWEHNKLGIKTLNLKPLILSYIFLIGAFLIGNPFFLLDFEAFFRDIRYTSFVLSEQGNIVNGLYGYIKAVLFPFKFSDIGDYFGIVSLVGVGYAFYKRTKTDLLLLIFPIVLLLYTAYQTANFVQPRYLLPAIPLFYIFGARLICDLINKIKLPEKRKAFILYSVVFILFFHPLKYAIKMCYAECQKDTVTLAREWIEENVPANSKILYTERYDLKLKENKQSLIDNYKIRENKRKRYSNFSRKLPNEKINAMANYPGIKYYIAHLPEGGDKLTSERAAKFGQLPPGYFPMDEEKILFDYWLKKNIQYVIVFPHKIKKYFTDNGKTQYPEHVDFYSQLFQKGQLIKHWKPEYPHRPGIEIKIFKILTE